MTSPGWYPDPWHDGNGPAPLRWWDGATWTAQVQPGGGPGGGRRAPLVAILVGAAVLVAGAVVAAVLLLGGDDGDGGGKGSLAGGSATPSASSSPDDGKGSEGSDSPAPAGQLHDDKVNGLRIPLLDGWKATDNEYGVLLGTGDYPCPSLPQENCLRGGVSSFTAAGSLGGTAEQVAKADIADNAQSSYGADSQGRQAYGGIDGHDEVAAEAVTVAGRPGYLVRWKVQTAQGDDGIVQSVAFESPHVKGAFVVLRFGFDDSAQAPTVEDMKRIVAGVEKGAPPTGGGSGGTGGFDA
ncbi:DUF2510 domain-containing protein [Streptomyces sp. NPDC051940]|uniref:DUF2510 domain-containing protein n=1 Tax=Streptomyces sp. NPDC051940 TaxID=3155675 RepID=UPI003413B3A8